MNRYETHQRDLFNRYARLQHGGDKKAARDHCHRIRDCTLHAYPPMEGLFEEAREQGFNLDASLLQATCKWSIPRPGGKTYCIELLISDEGRKQP